MEFESQDIKCSIFLDVMSVTKRTDAKIKEVGIIKQRQYYAQDILVEARSLLSCSHYNAKNPDCLTCHSVSHRFIEEYKCLARAKEADALSTNRGTYV